MSQRPSQRSQGTPRSQSELPRRELEEAAQEAVRYLLMHDYDKHPIKQTDIVKNALKVSGRNSGQIFDLAAKKLKEVFGLELVPLNKSTRQFILINALEQQQHVRLTKNVESNLLLLAIILTFIFMVSGTQEGGVETNKVHEFLATLDIDVNDEGKHDYFGNVKEAIDTLRAQQYLEREKMPLADPPKFEYKWGERSFCEFSVRKALKFASEMCNVDNMEKWAAHYKVVLESEGN